MINHFLTQLGALSIATVADSALPADTKTVVHSASEAASSISPLIEHEGLLWLYALALFIAAGFALKYWFRNFSTGLRGPKTAKLKILEIRVIGHKQSLLVAQYEEQKLLLGVSPGIIQLIARLGTEDIIVPQSDFSNYLATDLLSADKNERIKKRPKQTGSN